MKRDRQDDGRPGKKEYQEFRTLYAAIQLFAILLEDLDKLAPGYATNLRQRLSHGIAVGEGYLDEDPTSDGPALIPGLSDEEPSMMDLSAAKVLEDQLFPDREAEDSRDFHQATRAMAVVSFHAALENYAGALGVTKPKTSLPTAITKFLSKTEPTVELHPLIAARLTEFHETRVLIIHNRSSVTKRYIKNVKQTPLEIGEVRSLSTEDLTAWAAAVWSVAKTLATVTSAAA